MNHRILDNGRRAACSSQERWCVATEKRVLRVFEQSLGKKALVEIQHGDRSILRQQPPLQIFTGAELVLMCCAHDIVGVW